MSQIAVNESLCRRDGVCVAVCPSLTLGKDANGFPHEAVEGTCFSCGHCVAVCPNGALSHSGLPQDAELPASATLPAAEAVDALLNGRRSVREFKDRPVSKETLEALLDIARRAPTAVNSQKLHWIVVPDAAKVSALSAESMNWLRRPNTNLPPFLAAWDRGYDGVMRGAPAAVVVCTPSDYEWGIADCAIALTFVEVAAEARGLGVCWAGLLARVAGMHPPLRALLGVPEGYTVRGGLMIGEPKYRYRLVPPRKPLSAHWL